METPPTWGGITFSVAGAWVERCRGGEGVLPERVVASFVPSGACVCIIRNDCFFRAFEREKGTGEGPSKSLCVLPCGSTKSSTWRTANMHCCCDQYQLFFESGPGSDRTTDGMAVTKAVISEDSDICNGCHLMHYNHHRRRTAFRLHWSCPRRRSGAAFRCAA